MKMVRAVSVIVLASAVVAGAGCASNAQDDNADAGSVHPSSESPENDPKPGTTVEKRVQLSSQLSDTVDKALPGVVGISTKRVVDERRRGFPFGFPFGRKPPRQERKRQGMGSGVVVDEEGTILTNHHVVKNAQEIAVKFTERRGERKAKIVGTDKATDIAVLKLKNPPDDLQPLAFGDSDALRLGEPVVAIGNPFGLSGSVTYGIVSAKGRANVGLADYEDFIQTDAAINPGNSGGALVNLEGELVGINTAILSRSGGYQGIGFAIPSNMAQSVMKKLLDDGEVERGYLGVLIQDLDAELAESFGVSSDTTGVVVSRVKEGSPADEAGLKRGDIVTTFAGGSVESASDLRNRVARQNPGDKVDLQVVRQGDRQTITVQLGKLGAQGGRAEIDRDGILKGLVLGQLDRETREKFNIPDSVGHGVVVANIERDSPAARTGLRPGDVILEVNREKLESIEQFKRTYEKAREGLLLLVFRDGNPMFLRIPKVN